MELCQLRYFVRAVRTSSMGSAVLDLNIGVLTLNQRMSRLESGLVICLLQRTSRGMTPTSVGLASYSQARLAPHHADDATLAAHESRLSGHVNVDMTPSATSVLGMPFINAIREGYSDVRLHMAESLSGGLEQVVNIRQIDLIVVFQKGEILHWNAIPILEEWLFLVGAHALPADTADDNIVPVQLASILLIMSSSGHDPRGRLEATCQEHTLNIETTMEIDGLALLMRAVRSGIDVTLQPDAAISHLDKETLRVVDAHNPIFSRLNFLMSLLDDGFIPAGLVTRVVLTKVMYQLAEAGNWPGAVLYDN